MRRREGKRERGREGERERGREGERERGRAGERERGREGGKRGWEQQNDRAEDMIQFCGCQSSGTILCHCMAGLIREVES